MSYNPYQPPQYPPGQQPYAPAAQPYVPGAHQNPQYPPAAPPVSTAGEDDDGGKWWQFMLYGIGGFAVAVWLFIYLSDKEREGGRIRMQWMFALVYDFLGKWGVTGVIAGLGTLCILIGTWQLVHRVRARA